MEAIVAEYSLGTLIGIALGLLAVVLLSVIAARLSKVIDLLDEIAELFVSPGQQPEDEVSRPKQDQTAGV